MAKLVVVSSVPKGMALKGLNFKADQPEILALDDSEYPPWLWTLLEPTTDENITDKALHKRENKKLIKQSNFLKSKKK
ncbi:54S ribosomal protein L37, mitochondrial [Smittium mucronatum]|uniref:Large ribosomal subunit protein mL54 n=1 Tax=Smittium mucronatum TaxID=133383 RepID=A0A1R0GNM7_9FUNG|nr:54S ribosomal protein L37, mitochondrial [Smittium mucronatum]OLY81676.1 54S ribosomal protein L37, mitochondrial [Smittium mucronatum]